MLTYTLCKTACAIAASAVALAGPLDKTRIGSDAKWIVHIDVDGFRKSALGQYAIDEFVMPALENAEQLKDANLSINLTNISSITAYGPTIDKGPEGVLMITTSADVRKDLDSVAGMFLLSAGTNAPFTMIEKEPLPLYSLSKTVYFAPGDHMLFVAKSREQIEHAHQVVLGKAECLATSSNFKDFKEPARSYLTVAVAEGFVGDAGMPAQAQILKETAGGRISLGENDKNVFVNLVFQGRDDMATTRIQQVLQGIVALASLSQQDPDITQLASGIKVGSEGKNVLVNLEYPTDKTIQKIREGKDFKHTDQPPQKAKTKAKKNKAKNKSKAPTPEQGVEEKEAPPVEADKPAA